MTLISNQENTVFYGRSLGPSPGNFIVGRHFPAEQPDGDGFTRLGQGKFVHIELIAVGVYEVVARPENYRERTMTIAPPFTSRLGFTFEISDRRDGRSSAASTAARRTPAGDRPQVQIVSPGGQQVSRDSVTVVVSGSGHTSIREIKITVNGDPVPASAELERTRGAEFSSTQRIPLIVGQNLMHVSIVDQQGRVGHSYMTIERTESP